MNLVFILIFFLISGCSSHIEKTAPQEYKKPQGKALEGVDIVTSDGENLRPFISTDGQKILYSSSSRLPHRHAQVYELELRTSKTKRVSFNDGETLQASYIPGSDLITYISTTDENKEAHPSQTVNQTKKPNFELNSEIYTSSLDGETIERITFNPGFDGFPQWISKDELFYVSQGKDSYSIVNKNEKGSKVIYRTPAKISDFVFDPIGKNWLWIQNENEDKNTVVVARNKIQDVASLDLPKGKYTDLFWVKNSNTVLLSGKLEADEDFQIYQLDLTESCLKNVLRFPGDDTGPSLDEKASYIIFANNGSIYKKSYLSSNAPCIKPK